MPSPEADDDLIADLGDDLERLTDYEERLARGEIPWRDETASMESVEVDA